MDWHEAALGALSLVCVIGGWTWNNTTKQLTQRSEKMSEYIAKLFEKLDAHSKDDADHFARVMDKMHDNHKEILMVLPKRSADR